MSENDKKKEIIGHPLATPSGVATLVYLPFKALDPTDFEGYFLGDKVPEFVPIAPEFVLIAPELVEKLESIRVKHNKTLTDLLPEAIRDLVKKYE